MALSPKLQALVAAARLKEEARKAALPAPAAKPLGAGSSHVVVTPIATPMHEAVQLTLLNASHSNGSGVQNNSTGIASFNPEQLQAIELALQGKSFCLIGAAGTGKTTVTQEIISRVQQCAHMRPLADATKHLAKGAPAIAIVGFTNKAVNNIRKKLPEQLRNHCLTIHKLLEYQPFYYEVPDGNTGAMRTTMRFEPGRNGANPLPHISTLIIEESSMVGTDLFAQVLAALPAPGHTQFIFLGDLNQLPPVFGPSILGFKLADMRTVELTHVYRQALLSPIISLATAVRTNCLADNFSKQPWYDCLPMTVPSNLTGKVTVDRGEHGKLTVHPWKQRVSNDTAITFMRKFLPTMIDSGTLDPESDMILCPFNKSFGTIELNNIIADHLAKKREETVYEVIARYQRSYWAVGDRVMVDRHEAVITSIERTIGYYGKEPAPSSKTLDRWGNDPMNPAPKQLTADEVLNALDGMAGDDDEAKNLASHTIKVFIADLDEERSLNTAGDINSMLFGYVLTVHKSQGSEWPRVFLFLHSSHATMISRELVYTAVTRAKQELYIICEGDINPYENSIKRAASRPIIPGTTLAEKIEFFRMKAKSMLGMKSTKDIDD